MSRMSASYPSNPSYHRTALMGEDEARQIIAGYRNNLDRLLVVPEWEDRWADGLAALELPQPRRGIGLRGVLFSLGIEQKRELISWVVTRFHDAFPSETAYRLSHRIGLDVIDSKAVDKQLSQKQWLAFADALLFYLSQDYGRYRQARDVLFKLYRDVVPHLVNRLVFRPGQRADAEQEGYLALLHAMDKVQPGDRSFRGYAQSWVTRAIRNHLVEAGFAVHVPINLASRTLGRGEDETPAEPGSPEAYAKGAIASAVLRLDQPTEPGDDQGLLELPDAEADDPRAPVEDADLREALERLISDLTPKQRELLRLRYGLVNSGDERGLSLSEAARRIGISCQQASMREKRALKKLAEELGSLHDARDWLSPCF